ncbi:hypothetical protein QBC34DRAFT_60320 [Podospora aff. communis PSN243]|uniref:Uncharacterized protein n=1 Tax=Podospora aff. communis PSN243 TaxID=3040156 RepID=A0AAV9GWE3_9PEZI|nr:hypothetical protein QBC34DRAFT_60320 [Podospora aff. communis PSN243]
MPLWPPTSGRSRGPVKTTNTKRPWLGSAHSSTRCCLTDAQEITEAVAGNDACDGEPSVLISSRPQPQSCAHVHHVSLFRQFAADHINFEALGPVESEGECGVRVTRSETRSRLVVCWLATLPFRLFQSRTTCVVLIKAMRLGCAETQLFVCAPAQEFVIAAVVQLEMAATAAAVVESGAIAGVASPVSCRLVVVWMERR